MMEIRETDIVIVGGGLTGLTLGFYLNKYQIPFKLLEKSNRLGGVMQTYREDGFTYEAGPNTGVLATPEIAELIEALSDKCELEIADPKAKSRWIWKKGKWHTLPSGPVKAVRTPLFSFNDKIRILGEPFRSRGKDPNESLARLVRRRLGKSYLDYAVDPFISGVYAGDPEQLVTRFALPKLYNLEQQYGSFIKGAIKKKDRSERENKATRDVFSVKGGLSHLIDALQVSIPTENIVLNTENITIEPRDSGFMVKYNHAEQEQSIRAKKVITTIGAFGLNKVLPFLPARESGIITSVPYARVIQVVLGYKYWDGIPVNAFGGLVPSRENRDILGILFTSSFFQQRAPEQGCVLSVFLGGIRHPEVLEWTDEKVKDTVLAAVKKMLKPKTDPDLLRIFRYEHAIPQYDITMEERLKVIESVESTYPGLVIAGNVKDGIGMANRVEQARTIADRIKANAKN